MRKSVLLTILLTALAAVSLCYAHGWVNREKAAVTIDETVLSGDRSVAEGITVDCSMHCNNRLFWDTRYTIGENPEITTDFSFSQAQTRLTRSSSDPGIYLDSAFGSYSVSTTGSLGLSEEALPFQDVASRTEPGELYSETIYVKDYYDFYPIDVGFSGVVWVTVNEDSEKLFEDYFRIPVRPEHRVQITIDKDNDGNVREMGVYPFDDSGVYFDIVSIVTDTGCFFIVSCRTTDGTLLDTGFIPGGYGIYHFPLYKDGVQSQTLTADELQTVFAIDAERAEVVTLQINTDKSKLLLVTIEDGAYLLTVIDIKTMTQLQKLALLTVEESAGFERLYIESDFIAPILSDGRFAVLTADAQGGYEARFTGDFSENEELKYVFSQNVSMDYNGEALVVAAFQDGWYTLQNYCSFYLAVYDPTGLTYAGRYQTSLDSSFIADHSLACLPVDENPLTVTWGG